MGWIEIGRDDWLWKGFGRVGECDLSWGILVLNLDREIENAKTGDRDFVLWVVILWFSFLDLVMKKAIATYAIAFLVVIQFKKVRRARMQAHFANRESTK